MPSVYVIGAGGVGFYFSMGLVNSGIDPQNIIVYDDDDLQGGLGHARLPRALPTTKKLDLLKGVLRAQFGKVPQLVYKKFTGNEPGKGDLVVDCSDMHDRTRKRVWNRAKERGARMLRISYDGANSTIVVVESLPFAAGRPEGYTNVPSLALSLAAGGFGAEVVSRIIAAPFGTEFISYQVSISDFVKPLTEERAAELARQAKQSVIEKAVRRSKKKKLKSKAAGVR